MKLTCQKDILSESISIVQRAVSSKSSIAALEGILLDAGDDRLRLLGYDLEIGIECTAESQVEEPGAIVLNARILGDIVRRLPEDTVHISADDKQLVVIRCGMSEFTILGTRASEFPEMPKVTGEMSLTLPRNTFKSMIRQTVFAVSQNDSKPVHTGSLFDVEGNQLRVVSVDGFRLALRQEIIENSTGEEEFSFVVPGKTLHELIRLLPDSDEGITLTLTKKHIVFEMDNFTLVSRLLEGEFLNYKNAIPKECKLTVTAQTKLFTDSIERASLLINDRIKSPVRCNFELDAVKLTCATPIGKVYDEFPVASSGGSLEIGFNNRYMLDALKACEEDQVKLELGTSLSPIVLKPLEGEGFVFLVLPVRLKNED